MADLNHPNLFTPEWQQLYIGWADDGAWVNYTVEVKQAGTYTMIALYSYTAQTISFSLNGKLPRDPTTQFQMQNYPEWQVWHVWNTAECGEINFPKREGNCLHCITNTETTSPTLISCR